MVVEALVASTKEMQETNKALEARLATSKLQINNLQHSLDAIRNESLTDPLTSLGNRKFFDRAIDNAIQNAIETAEPLTLLMLDIDHFKSFNDNYGHLTGDQVLRLVALSLKQTIKGQDITARYGGEEFAVVLPNTALRQALTVADNIRRAVMSKQLKKKSTGEILGRVTISVGVSMLQPGDDRDRLIERADACLYAAKRDLRSRSGILVNRSSHSGCLIYLAARFGFDVLPAETFAAAFLRITAFFAAGFGLTPAGVTFAGLRFPAVFLADFRAAARFAAPTASRAQTASSSGSS